MEFIKKIFGSIKTSYLIRAYILGGIFTGLLIYPALQSNKGHLNILYAIVCFILFPFSKLVYDEIKRVMLGNNIFIVNLIILLPMKFIINVLLYCFAIIIAPIGILYLILRIKKEDNTEIENI